MPEELERQEDVMSGKPSQHVMMNDPDDGEEHDEPRKFHDASSSFPKDPLFEK